MPHVRRKDGKEFFPKGAFNASPTLRRHDHTAPNLMQ